MKHRDPAAMLRNARAAIPLHDLLSANQVFKRQALPRLPLPEVRDLLESLAHAGEIECIEIGFKQYFRQGKPRERGVALRREVSYTTERVNKFFPPTTEVDWFLSTLSPLSSGKAVHLRMDDPRLKMKGRKATDRLVILVPGPIIGAPTGVVLVSIIGSGSCVLKPSLVGQPGRAQIANLVLAGMPAKLANHLMKTLHIILKE